MRIGSAKRPLNGPESRALRTGLHLERRHVSRLINLLRVLDGRFQNDDVTAWERGEEGYPYAVVKLLVSFEDVVTQISAVQFVRGCIKAGECEIVQPELEELLALFDITTDQLVLEARSHPALVGEGADLFQRLFDAVVARIANRCEHEKLTFTILTPGTALRPSV